MKSLVVFSLIFASSLAFADGPKIFDSQVTTLGFKKIPPGDALNQFSFDLDVGGFESTSSDVTSSQWKNLYLAFAVDVRYARDCYGSRQSVLCTYLHSGVQLTGNLTWNSGDKGAAAPSTDRYQIVLIPIEYVTGTFGKEGPDLKTTSGALFATVGGRAEFLRDLGLDIQNRIIGEISGGVNYSSSQQALGETTAFRWIGSVRVFAGGGAANVNGIADTQGTIVAGLETQLGLALDLSSGTVAFTNSTRHEGDWGLGGAGLNMTMNSEKIEVKYLHSICRSTKRGGCSAPRVMSLGGGVRYEYDTASFRGLGADGNELSVDRHVHRLIFFAELARF